MSDLTSIHFDLSFSLGWGRERALGCPCGPQGLVKAWHCCLCTPQDYWALLPNDKMGIGH